MNEAFLSGHSIQTEQLTGYLYPGLGSEPHPGVLVLHGSGGAGGYERTYAARLAEHGYTTLCVDYFDALGVPDALAQIPLEYFQNAAEWLLEQPNVSGDNVGFVGFSRGGEAALLAGAHFKCIGVIAAYVPSCYAFPAPTWMEGIIEECAAWTLTGEPIPYLPVDKYIEEDQSGADEALGSDAPNASTLAIEQATDEELRNAMIEVENITGSVVLISGGTDQIWPSTRFSNRIIDRLERCDHPWQFEHHAYPDAGHAIRVPYRFKNTDSTNIEHRFGGTNETNAYASADAWYHVLSTLQAGLGD